ncbi:MAG: trypsin-like peptidase domain-containing protein [Verrucomicrobiales bacterium]
MKLLTAILAVCTLLALRGDAGQFGTGFAISPKGYLVTCYHVVRNAERILIHTPDGIQSAHVVALDPANDLAVLKVDNWRGKFLGLSSPAEVKYGEEVVAAGFPDPAVMGKNPKISKGIVSSLSGIRDDPRYLQVSAPAQPGNSGGPLLSSTGRVVGVVAAGLNSRNRMEQGGYVPQSVNYAIKSELIGPILENASISTPVFGTRTKGSGKIVERAIGAIALVESIEPGHAPVVLNDAPPAPFIQVAASPAQSTAPTLPPRAPNPWIFPDSHARPLQPRELQNLPAEALWRARNEIYLRHGFAFTTPRGHHFASQFGNLYRPRTASVAAIQENLSHVEIANLRLIADFEHRAGS